jgi:hypothetical protein
MVEVMRGGGIMWKVEDIFFYAEKASLYRTKAPTAAF